MGVDSKVDAGFTAEDIGSTKAKPKSVDKTQGRRMPKILRNTTLVVGALVGTWIGSATATELTDQKPFLNNPAYTDSLGFIPKAMYDILHPLGWIENLKRKETSLTADKVDEKTIREGVNAFPITTPEKLTELLDKAIIPDGNGSIRILLPAELGVGESVKQSSQIIIVNSFNAETGEPMPPEEVFMGRQFILEKNNTRIPLLVKDAEIFQLPPTVIEGKSYFRGLILKLNIPNRLDFIIIEPTDDIRNLILEDSLKNAPKVTRFRNEATSDVPFIANAQNGISLRIDGLNPPSILKTTKDNTNITIRLLDFTPGTGKGNTPFDIIKEMNDSIATIPFIRSNK